MSIEQAICTYLNGHTPVTALLGDRKVFYSRVPQSPQSGAPTVKMPWVVVSNVGGGRKKDSAITTEARDTLEIYVDDVSFIHGQQIAEAIRLALEHYRGDMAPERDLWVEVDTPRDLDGFQGACRFIIAVYVRYRQTTTRPN